MSTTRLSISDNLDQAAAELEGRDVVFAQFIRDDRWGALRGQALAPRLQRFIEIPNMNFVGLHPDCVYIRRQDGTNIQGPVGPYHSALAIACYLEGLSSERTLALFNAHSFARLGYFAAYDAELKRLTNSFATAGYTLSEALADAPSVFMHTVNHPTIQFLFGVVRQALRMAGIAATDAPLPEDNLARQRWAVFPEIAARLGITEQCGFLAPKGPVNLDEFVHRSLDVYAREKLAAAPPAVERARRFIREHVHRRPPAEAERAVGEDEIRQAYRLILGRNPTDVAVANWVARQADIAQLRLALLKSSEFQARYDAIRARS